MISQRLPNTKKHPMRETLTPPMLQPAGPAFGTLLGVDQVLAYFDGDEGEASRSRRMVDFITAGQLEWAPMDPE